MQKPEQKQQQQLQNKQNADANNFAALFICAMCVRLCVCLLFLCCLGSSSSIRRFSFSFYPRFVASNFQCCFRYWRSVILLRLQQQLFLLLLLLLLFLFCHNERTACCCCSGCHSFSYWNYSLSSLFLHCAALLLRSAARASCWRVFYVFCQGVSVRECVRRLLVTEQETSHS